MQHKARPRESEQHDHVARRQRRRLEDALHHGHVYQRQLRHGRDRHRRDEVPVLREMAPEPAVLDRGHEVEEDEGCECL